MLVSYINGRVKICIEAVAARTAKEQTLRTSIVSGLMPTFATRLRRMTWVNLLDTDTALLPFIGNEAIQLSKCPTVQLALILDVLLVLAASHLGTLPYIGKIFQDDSCTSGGTGNNLFTEYMVTIPMETRLFLRHLFQVSLSRLTSVGLQFALEAKRAMVNLFPSLASKKLTIAGNGGAIESQINTNNRIVLRHNRFGYRDNHMQPPFPIATQQVSSSNRVTNVLHAVVRDRKGNSDFPATCRKPDNLLVPFEGVGMHVVADRTRYTLRTLDRLETWFRLALCTCLFYLLDVTCFFLGFPSQSRFHGFGCLNTRLNEDIRDKPRTGRFTLVVRRVMQAYPVAFLIVPPIPTYQIEGVRELCKRFTQEYRLFRCRMKLYFYGSAHTRNIPYMGSSCQMKCVNVVERGVAFLP